MCISEDGTGITNKIQYDSKTDFIVGFVSPLGGNGFTRKKVYPANYASVIQEYFENCPRANYAYAIMAQPLKNGTPAIVLNIHGTNNKFTYKDVLNT